MIQNTQIKLEQARLGAHHSFYDSFYACFFMSTTWLLFLKLRRQEILGSYSHVTLRSRIRQHNVKCAEGEGVAWSSTFSTLLLSKIFMKISMSTTAPVTLVLSWTLKSAWLALSKEQLKCWKLQELVLLRALALRMSKRISSLVKCHASRSLSAQ